MSRGRKRRGFKAARVGRFIERQYEAAAQLEPDANGAYPGELFVELFKAQPHRFTHADLPRLSQTCKECGGVGHWLANCPAVICRGCGGTGHIAKHCPQATT